MKSLVVGDNLAKNLAGKLKLPFIEVRETIFPDGEVKPSLKKTFETDKAIVLLQKKAKENINSYLIKYYLLLKNLRNFAHKTIAIIPYFPYARQDAVFLKGEPLSSQYIAELIEENFDELIVINFHEHRKKINELFKKPAVNLSVFSDFKHLILKKEKLDPLKTLIIGPDEEANKFVDDFIGEDKFLKYIFHKERNKKTGEVNFNFSEKEFQGLLLETNHLIIVDDIVSSGKTINRLVKTIRSQMTKKDKSLPLDLVFVHPILSDKTFSDLKNIHFNKIYSTNSLENKYFNLEIGDVLSKFFKEKRGGIIK